MRYSSLVFVAAAAVQQVAAHGFVPQIKIGNTYIPGWDVGRDGYVTPRPNRVVRATKPDSGFISDPKSSEITCSIGNAQLPTAPVTATVAAGQTVTMLWNTWPIGHVGPVINYLAKCTGSCSSFKGDTGTPWFKIQQEGYTANGWATDLVAKNNFTSVVKIPSYVAPGEYLLRHELLALHGGQNPGGAQFYPVCVQLTITGSGSKVGSGLSFPGAYSATDPGILFNPYRGEAANQAYVAPGGPVYSG